MLLIDCPDDPLRRAHSWRLFRGGEVVVVPGLGVWVVPWALEVVWGVSKGRGDWQQEVHFVGVDQEGLERVGCLHALQVWPWEGALAEAQAGAMLLGGASARCCGLIWIAFKPLSLLGAGEALGGAGRVKLEEGRG